MTGFTHLHVASCLSPHFGTAWPEVLVEAQAAMGCTAAALTDRDGLYGAVRHIRTCVEHGIAPIVGAELLMDDGSTITVLAHGHDQGMGWASLCRLVSAAHHPRRGERRMSHGSADRIASVSPSQLKAIVWGENGPTVTVLLGPDSDVGRAVLTDDSRAARAALAVWNRLLPGGVVIEAVCHWRGPDKPASVVHAAALVRFAQATGTPVVVTNAVRYLTPDDSITGDILDSASLLLPLGAFPQQNAESWLKPPAMMEKLTRQIVEYAGEDPAVADEILTMTEKLADQCALDPVGDVRWREPKVPELATLGLSGDPERILTQRCWDTLPSRYPHPSPRMKTDILTRLEEELHTIQGFGFATYFLTVADVTDMIKHMGVRVQARGSGAGSLVNYLLGISIVDPLEHGLLFERFLGSARSTLPDIDIDVESARRHDIYRAVTRRYGFDRVTLLSMQNQYRARGAIRDTGLALGLPDPEIDDIAKSMWRLNAADVPDALQNRPELADVARRVASDRRLRLLVDLTPRLNKLPRHISMHPCGVILSDDSLLSTTPTQPSGLGLPMSQYDKDDIDDMGLLKLDVLGVRMQSSIAYTLDEIQRLAGDDTRIDLDHIPHDDPDTYRLIQSTHTLGIFQIESPGQRELVGKMQPDCMADLIADISLFRPGPMKGHMVLPYVEAKQQFRSAALLHPSFRSFLADSHGVVIYHEHVLRIFHECMGVSLAEADELRRRLGQDADSIEQDFRQHTSRRVDQQGRRVFSDRQIDVIWATLKGFGSFGFCKAHAASFALTTYQTAYLKAHYPAEFTTGLLEHDPGMYPKRLLITEAKRLGITVLGVDVNTSTSHYRVETSDGRKSIRMPFTQISGISTAEVRRLVQGQPFESIHDLYTRAHPTKTTLHKLAAIGGLDSLVPQATRGQIIAHIRHLTAHPRPEQITDQDPLLAETGESLLPDTGDTAAQDQVAAELEFLHTEVTGHVLDPWRPILTEIGVTPASDLLTLRNESEVLVAGIRVASQTPPTKSGKRVVFISLDDGTGISDCAFFDEAQAQTGANLFQSNMMLVRGTTRRTGPRGISIQANDAWDLTQYATSTSRSDLADGNSINNGY